MFIFFSRQSNANNRSTQSPIHQTHNNTLPFPIPSSSPLSHSFNFMTFCQTRKNNALTSTPYNIYITHQKLPDLEVSRYALESVANKKNMLLAYLK